MRSRGVFRLSALDGSLRVCAFICGLLLRRLPSIGARRCGSVVVLPSVHACCLSFDKQDGLRQLAFLFRRVGIAFVRSRGALRLSAFVGSLRVWTFLAGDLDGVTGDAGNGKRGWRRGLCASLRSQIGTVMLSAGSTLGLRAPDCAKESSTLWTLLTLRRGRVNAYTRRRHPGTRKDPPGSNLWPGGSGCIKMLSTRSNIQTRAAPKRRGVGLQRAKRCACRLSLPRACRRG